MKQYKESIDNDKLIFVSNKQIEDFCPISHCFDTEFAKKLSKKE